MPLQDHHQIVSVDDHVVEHPRVFTDRVAEKFQENAPKIVETEQGHHVWLYDGNYSPNIGLNAVAGKDPKDFGMDPVRFEDMIPGCYDPIERVKDMDIDGVQAALCFPTFPGFGGGTFMRATDKELALECVKAWNDFMVDEWCASAPERLVPLALLPLWDMQASVKEAERVAAKGARTISFPDSPVPLGLPSFHSDEWAPLFNVCEEAEIPLSLHFGSSGFVPGFSFSAMTAVAGEMDKLPDAPFAVAITSFASNLMWSTVDLLFSGTLQRHPNLQFSLAEGGIGWIPYILERSDYVWDRHRHYQDIAFDDRPSDLFRKHFWGCFIDDEHGLANRHERGNRPHHAGDRLPALRLELAEQRASAPPRCSPTCPTTSAR